MVAMGEGVHQSADSSRMGKLGVWEGGTVVCWQTAEDGW